MSEQETLQEMVRELVPGVNVSVRERDTLNAREYQVNNVLTQTVLLSHRTIESKLDPTRFIMDQMVELTVQLQKLGIKQLGLAEYMTAREEVMMTKARAYLLSRGVDEQILLDLDHEMKSSFYDRGENDA